MIVVLQLLQVNYKGENLAILEQMREAEVLPTELVDVWQDSYVNSQLSKVSYLALIFPKIILQILFKEGLKCTQEKARTRPKMKEVRNKSRIQIPSLLRFTRS